MKLIVYSKEINMDDKQKKALIKLLNIAKLEMLDWFNQSVIGWPDSKQRFMVKVKRIEIEESNK